MSAIQPTVDPALVIVPPSLAETVVRDRLDARVRRMWLRRGAGNGTARLIDSDRFTRRAIAGQRRCPAITG